MVRTDPPTVARATSQWCRESLLKSKGCRWSGWFGGRLSVWVVDADRSFPRGRGRITDIVKTVRGSCPSFHPWEREGVNWQANFKNMDCLENSTSTEFKLTQATTPDSVEELDNKNETTSWQQQARPDFSKQEMGTAGIKAKSQAENELCLKHIGISTLSFTEALTAAYEPSQIWTSCLMKGILGNNICKN